MKKHRKRTTKTKKDRSATIKRILSRFPKLDAWAKLLVADISKTAKTLLLRLRILDALRSYSSLTVKTLYYRLFSLHKYPNNIKFYKRYGYSLKKLRRLFPDVDVKFEDPTRKLKMPQAPVADVEVWVEKSGLEYMLEDLVVTKYHAPLSAMRGYASITFFRKAVERGARRKPSKILLVLDHDPSGINMEEVVRREMAPLPDIEIERVAVTLEQTRKYKLAAGRVKRKDSRAKKYVERFGSKTWEVESLEPRMLLAIIERRLKQSIRPAFLERLRQDEYAQKLSKPIERKIARKLRSETLKMIREGLSEEEIQRRLAMKFIGDDDSA